MKKTAAPRITMLLLCALLLSGCAIHSTLFKDLVRGVMNEVTYAYLEKVSYAFDASRLEYFSINCSETMNNSTPMTVDILFIYNSILAKELLKKSAGEWFAAKRGYRLKYGLDFDMLSYQLIPNYSVIEIQPPNAHRKALNVLLFADYIAPGGQTPVDLTKHSAPVVILEQEDIRLAGELAQF